MHSHTLSHTHTSQRLQRPTRALLDAQLQALRAELEGNKDYLDQDTTDALQWWSEQGRGAIAILCPVARMYLAIPCSTADVERSWSSAAFLSVGRARLLPKNLERQMVIRDWILECARTHGNGTQGYFRAIDELVEGLGRTRVPEEEDGEDDMLADSDTDV